MVIHFLGFLGVMLPLIVLGPHGSATEVFTTFINGAGWPRHGLSFIIGIIGNVWTFVGMFCDYGFGCLALMVDEIFQAWMGPFM